MTKEYKIIKGFRNDDLEKQLEELSGERWEVISSSGDGDWINIVLWRRKI